jgi:hypothetical protein
MIDFGTSSPDVRFVFRRKPLSMPADNRLSWRLPVLLLALDAVRGKKATFKQIALLSYVLNNRDNRSGLEAYFADAAPVYEVPVRFEPGLPFLLQVAVKRGLISVSRADRYGITSLGKEAVAEIRDLDGFESEIQFLDAYGKRLTDAEADRILALEIRS